MPADGADLTTLSLQAELTHDGRCTLTFLNPAALTCITMIGTAERLPPAEEEKLHDTWPLFPPLPLLYPGEARQNFSGLGLGIGWGLGLGQG